MRQAGGKKEKKRTLDLPFFIEMFQVPETQILLTAFSGLLFIRSLDGRQN